MSAAPEMQARLTPDPLMLWRHTLEAADMTGPTIKTYIGNVSACANHAGVEPTDLTPDQITDWLRRPELSRNSRNIYYRSLVRWQAWLQATGRSPGGMLDGTQRPRPQRTHPKPISTRQLETVLAAPLTDQERAMILLAATQAYGATR